MYNRRTQKDLCSFICLSVYPFGFVHPSLFSAFSLQPLLINSFRHQISVLSHEINCFGRQISLVWPQLNPLRPWISCTRALSGLKSAFFFLKSTVLDLKFCLLSPNQPSQAFWRLKSPLCSNPFGFVPCSHSFPNTIIQRRAVGIAEHISLLLCFSFSILFV